MQRDAAGRRTGFFVDLAKLISAEIGVPITFEDFPSSRESLIAHTTGEAQMFAGIVRLKPMVATSDYSDPVAADVLRFAVLREAAQDFTRSPVVGKRIGVVPPVLGSEDPLLADNITVPYANFEAAIFALLAQHVDALLVPPPAIYRLALDAGVDGRIVFGDRVIRETHRYVALHKSRADLLEPVNAAIARLEANGSLDALRARYHLSIPPPPPDVLTLGTAHIPPFYVIDENGAPSGFAVDVFRDLADRAGLQFETVVVPPAQLLAGPKSAGVDVVPVLARNDAMMQVADFSVPVFHLPISIFTRQDQAASIDTLASLQGLRVAILSTGALVAFAEGQPGLDLARYDTFPEILDALAHGDVDAALTVAPATKRALGLSSHGDIIVEAVPGVGEITSAPALRFGLGAVREQLNAVIPGYLLSEDYAALRREYFGTPVFWTESRIYWALGPLSLMLLAFGGQALWARRRREKEKHLLLDRVVSNMNSQVMLIAPTDRILYVNFGGHKDISWTPHIAHANATFCDSMTKMVDAGEITIPGKSKEETRNLMIATRHQHGSEIEFWSRDRLFRRVAWVFRDGTVMLVRTDVTQDYERLEQERKHADELECLVTRLEHANREQAEFTYAISHDLKSPANTIGMLIEELSEVEDIGTEGQAVLDDMITTNSRMRQLVDDVLNYSRIVDQDMAIEQVDLGDLVTEICGDLKSALNEAGANLDIADLPSVSGNRMQLRMLFQNLISNAIKFRAPTRPPRIAISGHQMTSSLQITVADNGIGIPEEHRDRVFGLFQRLNAQSTYEGSGLGLTICQRVMSNHKGGIRVSSGIDGGTAFLMTFPGGPP